MGCPHFSQKQTCVCVCVRLNYSLLGASSTIHVHHMLKLLYVQYSDKGIVQPKKENCVIIY